VLSSLLRILWLGRPHCLQVVRPTQCASQLIGVGRRGQRTIRCQRIELVSGRLLGPPLPHPPAHRLSRRRREEARSRGSMGSIASPLSRRSSRSLLVRLARLTLRRQLAGRSGIATGRSTGPAASTMPPTGRAYNVGRGLLDDLTDRPLRCRLRQHKLSDQVARPRSAPRRLPLLPETDAIRPSPHSLTSGDIISFRLGGRPGLDAKSRGIVIRRNGHAAPPQCFPPPAGGR
jgi:hypothetical protein